MSKKLTAFSVLCAMATAMSGVGYAATDTDTFQVTATVVASCDVDAADMGMGSYDPVTATPLDGSTTMQVRCTNGTGYVIAMNPGTGSGATVANRRMTNGANTLSYSLYQDSGYTSLWGQSVGVDTYAGTGNGAAQNLTIYSRAPARQTAPAGAYTDTITVTLTY